VTSEMDPRLGEALRAAEEAPADTARWDELEELAEKLQRPDDVGQLYRDVLAKALPKELAESIGRRAVGYHEEWFGEESPHLVDVLTRVLAVDPDADWALQRATVLLTVRERWGDLLGLYDRALAAATETWRRTSLLEEAIQLAKDFAGQADRAIDYQKMLLEIRPDDAQLAASLERLLERQKRWGELIEMWRRRADGGAADASSLRERIASTYLDHVGDVAAALEESRALIEGAVSVPHAISLLERILAWGEAPAEVRRGALELLKQRYDEDSRALDVERVLSIALDFASREETIAIQRELGDRTTARGDESVAIGHFATLLLLDPSGEYAQQRLAQLAASTGSHERHADALVAAADAAYEPARRMSLLLEAGDVRGTALGDRAGAEPLYRRVLDAADASEATKRTAARRLVALLDVADRASDRLAVLERLAGLESDPSERRRVLGQGARLAEQVGESDRALALWQQRLEADPQDLEALDARIGVLEREGRWTSLIETLQLRSSSPVPAPLKRADLVRMATVQETELEEHEPAIATWLVIAEQFGENAETIDALSRLFAGRDRWTDLAAMLERGIQADAARAAEIAVRLADVRREHTGEPMRAAEGYHQALKLDPRHAGARAGLQQLIERPEAKAAAVEGLAEAAMRSDDHDALLSLLEHRLAAASGEGIKVKLLREAAELEENRRHDAAAALAAIRRAFLIVPDDEGLESEMLRHARALEGDARKAGFTGVVETFGTAVQGVQPGRAAHLHRAAAGLAETELDDSARALEHLLAAFAIETHDAATAQEVVRIGARLGAWSSVAGALVGSARARRAIDPELLARVESVAEEALAWNELAAAATEAMERATDGGAQRLGELGRALETRIAVWHRDRRGDVASAEAALARALIHESGHQETLRELARLQWRAPSRALVDTLLSLAERLEDDLDALHDAAKVALDPVGDVPLARQILQRLFRDSIRLWERGLRTPGQGAKGERPADATALWAHGELVRIELESERVAEAIDLLAQGARLPIPAAESQAMRRRAGDLARERLGDEARAMRLYQSIADESLEDSATVDRLAEMYERRGRIPELLALRQRELGERLTAERKLAVRLEVARLLGALESQGGRVEMLRANLAELPGHEPSIAEVASVLASKNEHRDLADLLTAQARKVEESDTKRGATLWSMVARIAEGPLADADRAIAAHRKVVTLDVAAESLDALAQLYLGKNEPSQAAEWLERRLEHARGAGASESERTALSLRLAEARLTAGRTDRAIVTLERALQEDRGSFDVRERLAALYRKNESWEPLARLLAEGAGLVGDEGKQLAYVREAAEIYDKRLGKPQHAIPILERGVQLAPDDQELRGTLAAGLRVAGRLDEARTILEKLVTDFGRRRSAERGAVHFQLAQVAHAAGDLKEALEQLDKASSMDLGHPGILKMLGDLAREAGQLDRAERAYRALLLLARRQASESAHSGVAASPGAPAVGVAEVLYELSRLATERDQAAQSKELLESAFETASHSALEAARFTRTLITRGEKDLAQRAIEMRLASETEGPARAAVLSDRAEILDRLLGQPDAALDASLEALELAPSRASSDAARVLAGRIGKVQRYVERAKTIVDRMRRKEDVDIASDLMLGLGEVTEKELGDLEGATRIYQRIEELGARSLDAWRALARVASIRGDHVEEIRVLRRLVAAGVDTSELQPEGEGDRIPEHAKTEAFYRIAEVELVERETVDSGLSTLADALARQPDHARAAKILHRGFTAVGDHEGIIALWERAARGANDPGLLLDLLEAKSKRDSATIEEVREGVEVATELGAKDPSIAERAEALLRRGVELARASIDGIASQLWLPIALSDRRREAGDTRGAIEWREVAADAAESAGDSEGARAIWRDLADTAMGKGGDLALAAKIYRRLAEAEPRDRALWQPLVEIHSKLRDRSGFEDAVRAILDGLLDVGDRNELRMAHAGFLIDVSEAQEDAIDVLRAVLDEDPDHLGAAQRLADIFERDGRGQELAEILQRQLDRARDRQDVPAIAALALRMGGLVAASDVGQAKDLYRQGLEWAPQDPGLLQALLSTYGEEEGQHERAALAERLLAVSQGEGAATLALELADLYALIEDADGVGRVLELGFRAHPVSTTLRKRVEAWHNDRGDVAGLADMIAHDAAHRTDPAQAVARYREAAALYARKLDRPEDASAVLRSARALAPTDHELLGELVSSLVACGRPEDAAIEVGAALEALPEKKSTNAARAQLLRLRGSLRQQGGDGEGALEDLEAAYAIDRAGTFAELAAALDRRRTETDRDTERTLTMRLANVLHENGEQTRSRDVLADWSDRAPSDVEVLRALRAVDTKAGRHEDVMRHCMRLVESEQGDLQIDAALALLDSARKLGRPEDARAGLERANADQPADARVRDALRSMYEAAGAWGELTSILLADAASADSEEAKFEALRRAGELLTYEVQDPTRAIEPLREALAFKDDDAETIVILADALVGAGALAEAVELLQNAIGSSRRKRSPALAMMQLRMARIAGLSGDHQTQLEWLKVALESDKTNGTIAAELAELAMSLGDDGTAMNALKVVTLQKTPGPMSKAVAFLRQAQIAHRAGDHQKAVLWARRAKVEDAELGEAEEFLRGIGEG
jgi:tetratricopeptide (TPR) repeat protein